MNALVSLDSILEPQQALTATSLFGSGQVETILTAIEKDVRAEAYDITTEEGRDRIKSVAYKIARSKTTLDEIGKEHVAHIKAQSAAIDKERKTLRDRLDALKDEVRGPLTAWEEAEAARVDGHERALVEIVESVRFASTVPSSNLIEQRISAVNDLYNRDWQEFQARAEGAAFEANATLETMLATAKQAEADAAELAELRRLKAEREEADRKAEAERIAAQQAAERKAYEERREKERAEKAERDKAVAVAAAIEAERVRAEQEKAAAIEAEQRRHEQAARDAAAKKAAEEAAEQKRQANTRHRAKVHKAIAEAIAPHTCDVDALVNAIARGDIPHVSINY
ncbi:hypothetical protein J6524_05005 [Bradyrhizobium sp. WSM 1738]|uniref:hypothetical protein n=1 Tax=Bradyrhizobium hereditatis TaxID=2821405 RepID=UPI001CE28F40|nr:hypothetical protein [Bradyrhizobium hereditatis]MCA6114288.1 hypothetical protein [Bradyrhizobium hereditatis]